MNIRQTMNYFKQQLYEAYEKLDREIALARDNLDIDSIEKAVRKLQARCEHTNCNKEATGDGVIVTCTQCDFWYYEE